MDLILSREGNYVQEVLLDEAARLTDALVRERLYKVGSSTQPPHTHAQTHRHTDTHVRAHTRTRALTHSCTRTRTHRHPPTHPPSLYKVVQASSPVPVSEVSAFLGRPQTLLDDLNVPAVLRPLALPLTLPGSLANVRVVCAWFGCVVCVWACVSRPS